MQKKSGYSFALFVFLTFFAVAAYAAVDPSLGAKAAEHRLQSVWDLIVAGGWTMAIQALLSVAAGSLIVYQLRYVREDKLVPADFCQNLYVLLEKKEYDKAIAVCKQQENVISAITLGTLQRFRKHRPENLAQIESVVSVEGKSHLEKLWQNLTYLGDVAVVAPLVGLLGTVLGMINSFSYFKAGSVHPGVLTQGLAKAMVNTVAGLTVAVICLVFYSLFRGRISAITTKAEAAASEVAQILAR